MLSLSPVKILVVLLVALLVLGPDKLPGVARQLGALWNDVRRWRQRVEEQVRGSFPDLPPSHEISQVVRSPLRFLDRLADRHVEENGGTAASPGSPPDPDTPAKGPPRPTVASLGVWSAAGTATPATDDASAVVDDPAMN